MGFCPLIAEHVNRNNQSGIQDTEDPMQTRIKEYRARFSITQEDLAKVVGVRRETIVFLEQGKYNPSLKLAHDVARALHTTIDDLFIFEDDGPEPERTVLVE
ncbi:MAG: anaerobic benzoate catabolism transcriptional regulator [Methanoregula sp. PtaU1.Bin006]|nr:MAG: anaerobic benzoate catabolism transcriptional regulator [Methanoregula sp. PtaB.Bin085]OPY34000.1 MAG: anaerobic benzoate catabolism transcriptional regulator [Methanoregula sp. PtaU1.Bin006]